MTDPEMIERLVIQLSRVTGTPEALVRLGAGLPPAAVTVATRVTGRSATGNETHVEAPTAAKPPTRVYLDHWDINQTVREARP